MEATQTVAAPAVTEVKIKAPKGLWKDGNAFAVLGKMRRALIDAGFPEAAKKYVEDAMSGSYSHLLAVTQSYLK